MSNKIKCNCTNNSISLKIHCQWSCSLYCTIGRHLKTVGDEVPQRVVTVLPVDVTSPNVPLSVANNLSLCTFSLPTGESLYQVIT